MEGFTLLSDVTESETEWVWEGRIPIGEITILEGDPGTNKSSLCCALAGCLTKGVAMPHATSKGRPRKGGTIFLVGEDSITKTVKPRLVAAGADPKKVAVLDGVSIPRDLARIKAAIREIGAKLVAVDTIADFVSGSVSNNQAMRKTLGPLRDLAEEMQVAILVLRHFTKKGSGKSLLRGGGSVAITGMARSQLKLYKHPEDEHLRVLIQDKSNLGPLSPALLFEVVSADDGQFCLECRGETDLTIADLESSKGAPKLEAATQFLREKLADGPKEFKSLVEQSKGLCSLRTLHEAKANLGLVTDRKGRREDQITSWALPTVEKPKKRQAKKPAGKKAASKAPAGKAPRAKQPARKKTATQKPASKTPRSKAPKVQVPKLSKYDIFE
jgi:archaellum biogenesis ATPase FlaH